MFQCRIQRVMQVVICCQNIIGWPGLARKVVLLTWMRSLSARCRVQAGGGTVRLLRRSAARCAGDGLLSPVRSTSARCTATAGSGSSGRLAVGWLAVTDHLVVVTNARPLRAVVKTLRCQTTLLLSGSSRKCYSLYDKRRLLLCWKATAVALKYRAGIPVQLCRLKPFPSCWMLSCWLILSRCFFFALCASIELPAPSQAKVLTVPCLLAIPAFDRKAGLNDRHLNSKRGICLR